MVANVRVVGIKEFTKTLRSIRSSFQDNIKGNLIKVMQEDLKLEVTKNLSKNVNSNLVKLYPRSSRLRVGKEVEVGSSSKLGGGTRGVSSVTVATLGDASKFLPFRDQGGEITPKKGKYLSIPTKRAKKEGLLSPKQLNKEHKFLFKSGESLLILRPGVTKKSKPQLLFVLRKLVNVKPTKWATNAIEKTTGDVDSILKKVVDKVFTPTGKLKKAFKDKNV